MILMGFSCPHCGADVLDSIDHCYKCGELYTGTLATVVQAHHAQKLAMVADDKGRDVSQQRILEKVTELGATSQSIATVLKAGGSFAKKMVRALFQQS